MATATIPRGTTKAAAPPDDAIAIDPAFGVVASIALDLIDVGDNVRVNVAQVDELADSIKEHGVLQPVKVRPVGGRFALVWGQRRVLASRKAGLERIPAIVESAAAAAPAELAVEQLVENLHRADLNPIDRAQAMRAVIDSGISQADLARNLGIAASTIANDVGLLEAPAKIQAYVERGELTPSHAKALKGLDAKAQAELAKDAVEGGWSAHETERRVQSWRQNAEYRRRQEEGDRAAAKARDEAQASKLAELAKKIPLDTPIRVRGYSYGNEGVIDRTVKLVEAAGFTSVKKGGGQDRPKGFCDCVAYQAEIGWNGGFTLKPACIVDAHYAAKQKADNEAWRAKNTLQERVRAKLAEVLVNEVATLPPLAARITLWKIFGWSIEEWAKKRDPQRAGKKRDPWATIAGLGADELRALVAERLAADLHDGNFKVDWTGLAAELGIETPA